MFNKPNLKQLSTIPKIKEQDSSHTCKTIIYAHFFLGGCDWYVSEFDGADEFFGFAILNNDLDNAEWGYFSFTELIELKKDFVEVDYDLHWTSTNVKDIPKIMEAGGSW